MDEAGKVDLDNPIIKVIDFGTSNLYQDSVSIVGSLPYMSPESLSSQRQNNLVDMWSLGAITYQLLSGDLPFLADNEAELEKKIIKTSADFVINPVWKNISHEAKAFMVGCLRKNSAERTNP